MPRHGSGRFDASRTGASESPRCAASSSESSASNASSSPACSCSHWVCAAGSTSTTAWNSSLTRVHCGTSAIFAQTTTVARGPARLQFPRALELLVQQVQEHHGHRVLILAARVVVDADELVFVT